MGGIVAHAYAGVMDLSGNSQVEPAGVGDKFEASRRFLRGMLLLAGPCCFLLAIGFAIRLGVLLRHGVTAEGTVVSMLTVHDADGGADRFAPVFIFHSASGRQFKVTSRVSTDPPEFTVGDRVEVIYPAGKPEEAKIESFWQLWMLPFVFCMIAVALSGFGFALQYLEQRRMRRLSAGQGEVRG